jgi:hypothetical protein
MTFFPVMTDAVEKAHDLIVGHAMRFVLDWV